MASSEKHPVDVFESAAYLDADYLPNLVSFPDSGIQTQERDSVSVYWRFERFQL